MSATLPIAARAASPADATASAPDDAFARFRRLARHLAAAPQVAVWTAADEAPAPIAGDPVLAPLGARVAAGEAVCVEDLRTHRTPGRSLLPHSEAHAFLGVPLRAADGSVAGALCVLDVRPRAWSMEARAALEDLAALAAQEAALREEAAERRALENLVRTLGKAVENMQLGVTVTDLEGRIVYTNPAEARMHGYEVEELIGRHARQLGTPESCRTLCGERIHEATSWTRETVNVRRDGSRFPVLLWSDVVADVDGQAIGIVTCSEDVTERKRAEESLREAALRDPLTGLPNRVFFLERLTQAIAQARRDAGSRFAVLFLDLDRFKVVNDSLGHHVGDELLVRTAERLLRCLRPGDVVARFGGDEFAVLLEGISDAGDAERVAECIHAELASPIRLEAHELFTSASIGIAMSGPGVGQPEELWRGADMAMYRAKAGGAGRYEVFDAAMHAEAVARLRLETDLRRAVERDELRLFYQPIVSLDDGRVVGFEALLRWLHPQRGMIPPAEIIPAAEETGMIHAIGAWVLHEACRQLAHWHAGGDDAPPLWVSINLSSKQLSQPDLVEQVAAAIRGAGIDPGLLKLEITETAVMEHTRLAAQILQGLKSLGVQLYMDDFGTGYSSLSYLHSLPLDVLKIDRSFVSRMERGNRHAHLVEIIVNLARKVNLRVVAEGISAPEHLALLREMGCELGQGFLFAQPLSRDDAEHLVLRSGSA